MILREAWREVRVRRGLRAGKREKKRGMWAAERDTSTHERWGAGEREGGRRGGWMEGGREGIGMMKRERREIQRCWGW